MEMNYKCNFQLLLWPLTQKIQEHLFKKKKKKEKEEQFIIK